MVNEKEFIVERLKKAETLVRLCLNYLKKWLPYLTSIEDIEKALIAITGAKDMFILEYEEVVEPFKKEEVEEAEKELKEKRVEY